MLTTRPVPRDELSVLHYDYRLRNQVISILNQTGYEFVDDPISNHYDARIKKEIYNLNHTFEKELGSMNLSTSAKAMITILWCLLILPKYDRQFRQKQIEEITISEEQLFENYKNQLGSKSNLRRILTTLKQLGFIETVRGEGAYKAGPRLTTALDSITMYEKIKGKIIEFLVNENEEQHRAVKDLFLKEDEGTEEESDYESAI